MMAIIIKLALLQNAMQVQWATLLDNHLAGISSLQALLRFGQAIKRYMFIHMVRCMHKDILKQGTNWPDDLDMGGASYLCFKK